MEDDKQKKDSTQKAGQEETPVFKVADIKHSQAGQKQEGAMNVHVPFTDRIKNAFKRFGRFLQRHHKKILIIAIIVAVAIAVGFGVYALVSGIQNSNSSENNGENSTSEQGRQDQEYTSPDHEMQKRAEEIYQNNPDNASAVAADFKEQFDRAVAQSNLVLAQDVLSGEYMFFTEKNLPKVALDALTQVDYSIFDDYTRYQFYSIIVSLADQLGDSATKAKYQPFLDQHREQVERSDQNTQDEIRRAVDNDINANKEKQQ